MPNDHRSAESATNTVKPGNAQFPIEHARHRRGGRDARRKLRALERGTKAVGPGLEGGAYRPLGDHDVGRIHERALDVLENIGMAEPIPVMRERAFAKGCWFNDHDRLCFPRALVEDAIAETPGDIVLHALDPKHDLAVGGERVHFGTSGEAISVPDFETGRYRPSTLADLYDFARLVDRLDNIHDFGQTVVATDVGDPLEHDINVAYACAAGTTKHLSMSFILAEHIDPAIALFDVIAGGEGRFVMRPFCSTGGCPVVSPLRFGEDNSEVVVAAAQRMGAPVSVCIAAQAGATAPAALAGTLVQTTAETLAALLLVYLVAPGHPVIFGNWPFVSDLRTGAFTGGGGEEAVLSAASAQIANYYGLPSNVGAGMSDSKLPDAQAGYEKGITNVLAGLAGANCVSESAGMLASLLGCSFEALVIDDDMLGAVQRAVRGIEVNDETLSYEVIEEAVLGPGHYLGHPQTLALMETEYVYPRVADRTDPDEWEDRGAPDERERARDRAREILATHYPAHVGREADDKIRDRFPIRLAREAMRPDSGRW